MKHVIAAFLIFIHVLTLSAPAFAQASSVSIKVPPIVVVPAQANPSITLPTQTLQPGETDVGPIISPMKKGQVAPFTGILFSIVAAASIVATINGIPNQIKVEVDHQTALDKAQCDFDKAEQKNISDTTNKVLQAQLDGSTKQVNILTDQVKKLEDGRPNTALWFGLGAGAGVVVTVLLTLALAYAGHSAGL